MRCAVPERPYCSVDLGLSGLGLSDLGLSVTAQALTGGSLGLVCGWWGFAQVLLPGGLPDEDGEGYRKSHPGHYSDDDPPHASQYAQP